MMPDLVIIWVAAGWVGMTIAMCINDGPLLSKDRFWFWGSVLIIATLGSIVGPISFVMAMVLGMIYRRPRGRS